MLGLPSMIPAVTAAQPTTTYGSLFNLYLIFALIAGGITIGALIAFPILYRSRKAENEATSAEERERGNFRVIGLVVILMVTCLTATAYASFTVKDYYLNPPNSANAVHINVTGFQWAWNFTYASGKSVIGQLRVPQDTVIILNITSQDVFHSFGIPSIRVKADAIPGRHNILWFQLPGTCQTYGRSGFCEYLIRCFELCGVGHAFMTARLIVMDSSSFTSYLNSSGV